MLDDFEHAPTIVINSGNGLNALWRLDESVLAPADGDWSQLEAYNKHLEDLLANRQCHNINRVLRLPYTWNIPTAKKLADGRKQDGPR